MGLRLFATVTTRIDGLRRMTRFALTGADERQIEQVGKALPMNHHIAIAADGRGAVEVCRRVFTTSTIGTDGRPHINGRAVAADVAGAIALVKGILASQDCTAQVFIEIA